MGTVEPANLARTAALYFHLGAATYAQVMSTQVMLEPICAADGSRAPRPAGGDGALPHTGRRTRTRGGVRDHTTDFHGAVYLLASNPVLTLLTQAVTHIVTHHVVETMDPVEMRPAILHEHSQLARAISAGHGEKAARMMADHFQSQHDYYTEHWPARLAELIEWR